MTSLLMRASKRQIFWTVLLLAAVVRMVAAGPYMVGWYGEIWKFLEPAWHMVGGPAVESWDVREGIRSWLVPQAIAVPMGLGLALSPESNLHLLLPRWTMAALSLAVVGCATQLGLRLSRLHGVMAGFVSAIWFELVFYAPRAMAEPIAFALMMGAVWLLVARKTAPRRSHFLFAGVLISLCFVVQIQYAPTLLMLILFTAKGNWRSAWRPLLSGATIGLSMDAGANLAKGAVPFRWMGEAARTHFIEGRAQWDSVMPLTAYLDMMSVYWSALFVPIIIMVMSRALRNYPVLLGMALVHFTVHSLIAHKEYRFILASTGLLIILAALASADLLRKVPRQGLFKAGSAMMAGWAAASAILASGAFRPNWSFMNDAAEHHQQAQPMPKLCGLAVYFPRGAVGGSYALLRENGPIYTFDSPEHVSAHQSALHAVSANPKWKKHLPAEYQAHRSGGCESPSTAPYQGE